MSTAVCLHVGMRLCLLLLLLLLLMLPWCSSEEWAKIGDTERGNLGLTVEDDGEFW